MAAEARASKVNLTISTDSHKPADFYFMKLGVYVARRAWCTPDDILNTRSWNAIQKLLNKKHSVVH